MVAVPATRTWVAGEVVTDAYMNNTIRDVDNFLLARPIFEGRQTVAQNLTSGLFADLNMDVEDVDSAGGHSTVTNTARYTGVYPGWYEHGGGMGISVNATNIRATKWAVNGTSSNASQISLQATGATSAQYPARNKRTYLNVGDYLTLQGFQNSGSLLATDVVSTDQSNFTLAWASN